MKNVTYKGMSVTEETSGRFTVSAEKGKYTDIVNSFNEAGMWLYEMADNHDIGRKINHMMCEKWKTNFA